MGTGRANTETVRKIEALCALLDTNYSASEARSKTHVVIEVALCKSFLRQGKIPYSFLTDVATSMIFDDPQSKGQFVEDVASICELTGSDLITRDGSSTSIVRG